MPSNDDRMLAVLKDAGIARVEWRMFYNNDEGDLDSGVATFSDGSRGPLPDKVRTEMGPGSLWDLADHEVFDTDGAFFNGWFVLDVDGRYVARTADVLYYHDLRMDDTERILEDFSFWTLIWERRFREAFDREAFARGQEEKMDVEDYFSVTPLENPQWYSL